MYIYFWQKETLLCLRSLRIGKIILYLATKGELWSFAFSPVSKRWEIRLSSMSWPILSWNALLRVWALTSRSYNSHFLGTVDLLLTFLSVRPGHWPEPFLKVIIGVMEHSPHITISTWNLKLKMKVIPNGLSRQNKIFTWRIISLQCLLFYDHASISFLLDDVPSPLNSVPQFPKKIFFFSSPSDIFPDIDLISKSAFAIRELNDTGTQVETKRDKVGIKIATFSTVQVDQSLILSR